MSHESTRTNHIDRGKEVERLFGQSDVHVQVKVISLIIGLILTTNRQNPNVKIFYLRSIGGDTKKMGVRHWFSIKKWTTVVLLLILV